MVQRIRRLVRGSVSASSAGREAKAKEILQSIAEKEDEIASLSSSLAALKEELEQEMRAGRLTSVTEGQYTAAIVRPSGKAQNVIDAHKFYDLVEQEDFFGAVSVSVSKAKELLGQKELDKITTKIPAKPGDEVLKITHKKAS